MKKVLLTGFEPFHNATSNPSNEILKTLNTEEIPGLFTATLPVEFGTSWNLLKELIEKVEPDFVVALGQAEGRNHITPERIAINLEDARIPDNAGNQPRNKAIVEGGADGLFSTLPIEQIVELLDKAKIPVAVSLSAGSYVCNHLFYALQDYCRTSDIKSGFIHVPLMDSQAMEFPGLPTLPLEIMVKGIRMLVTNLLNQP